MNTIFNMMNTMMMRILTQRICIV